MNKHALNRIKELKSEVENLSDYLYSEDELSNYNQASSVIEKNKIISKQDLRFTEKNKLIRKIIAFFNAHLAETSNYYSLLKSITFKPKNAVFNSFHYKDNEAWQQDKTRLLNLLELLENEFTEKLNANNLKKQNSFNDKDMFSSGLFWTIIGIVASVSFFLGSYKAEYNKTSLQNELQEQKIKYEKLINEIDSSYYKPSNKENNQK